jgi:hypothetical protein
MNSQREYHYECGVVDVGKKKNGAPRGSVQFVSIKFLEDELDNQLHRTSVAGESQLRLVKGGRTRVQQSCTNGRVADGSYVIDAARNELRMVEQVEYLRLELEFRVLSEADVLTDSEINVIDRTSRQRIALRV